MSEDKNTHRITKIDLDHAGRTTREEMTHERRAALHDILEGNQFHPEGMEAGPYHLRLSSEENRLLFHIESQKDKSQSVQSLSIKAFRGLIRDYFLVCESYYDAIASAPLSRVEELDRSRRSLHDEGGWALQTRLKGKITMDSETARRLFTILCVMHMK